MSLYGMMRTGVSGMNAQANRLSTVADNIANSGTTGYKRSSTEFSTLVLASAPGTYNSGGVTANVRNSISMQGALAYTTSVTDLAVNGNGFFVVQGAGSTPVLTRAGNFVPDAEGNLVNAAGFTLMGYSYANGNPTATANGFDGLEAVRISDAMLSATPSKEGKFTANLPSEAAIVPAGSRPSDNVAGSTSSAKSSLVAYDNLGNKIMLDVYFTKTGTNTWEATVFNKAGAAAGGSFPYAPGSQVGTVNLSFDAANGKLTTASAKELSLAIPNGGTVALDLSDMTQLATKFTVFDAKVDGNAPGSIEKVEIANDGTLYAKFDNGSLKALYKIPLANVQSPDELLVLPGNVFSESSDSGNVRIGFANEGNLGAVVSGALESSNVDIAEELTNMIESQRSYTANSKVFQTGSDLMDILVNLKR